MGKHRSAEERGRICEAWKQSGLSKIEFCRQNNIAYTPFSRWLSKFRNSNNEANAGDVNNVNQDNSKSDAIKFLQVGTIISERNFLEITLPNSVNFKFHLSQDNINGFLLELLKWK